jgi:hypothetical protein
MLRFIFLFFIFLFLTSNAEEKQGITKEQFCHFTYGIYQQCYQRGLMPGTDCEALSKGIRFGKAFTKSQITYIEENCKMGCFLGKNRLEIKNEDEFVSNCLK